MKNLIIIFALAFAAHVYAGKTFSSAIEYNDFLVTEINTVLDKYTALNTEFEQETVNDKNVWAAHRDLVKQCKASVKNVMDAEIFMEGGELKTACIDLLNMYTSFAENELVKTIEVILDEHRQQADLDQANADLDLFDANEKIYTLLFEFEQEDYALKYQFALAE